MSYEAHGGQEGVTALARHKMGLLPP